MTARKTTCKNHTRCPTGYVQWHVWAEKKSVRHFQVRCDECGLLKIWRRKPAGASSE